MKDKYDEDLIFNFDLIKLTIYVDFEGKKRNT